MKITVKPTRQEAFQVEVEPGQTVAELKAEIEKSKGYASESQKFLLSGRNLSDTQTFEAIGLSDGHQLVLMISKPLDSPSAGASSAIAPSESSSQPLASTSASITGSGDVIFPPPSNQGRGREEAHGSTGYAGDKGKQPMLNNSEHRTDYLANGNQAQFTTIPSSRPTAQTGSQHRDTPVSVLQTPVQQTLNQPRDRHQIFPGALQGRLGPQGNVDDRASHMRQMLQDNPHLRQHLIQHMTLEDPAFGQFLSENPGFFDVALRMASNQDGHSPPLTIDDTEHIEYLLDLGFTRQQAMEAYLVCGKDKGLAANYLLNHHMSDAPPVLNTSLPTMEPRPSEPSHTIPSTYTPEISRVIPLPLTPPNDQHCIVEDSPLQLPPQTNISAMTNQPAASMGVASQDSLNSVHQTGMSETAPSTPTREQGNGKEKLTSVIPASTELAQTSSTSPPPSGPSPSTAHHVTSMSSKAEGAAAEIHRLEGNHSILVERVEGLHKQFGEQITNMSVRVHGLSNDLAMPSTSTVGNTRMDELISSVIAANNDSVALVKHLQKTVDRHDAVLTQLSSRVDGMQHAIDTLHSTIDRLAREESQSLRRRPSFTDEAPPSERRRVSPPCVFAQQPYANVSNPASNYLYHQGNSLMQYPPIYNVRDTTHAAPLMSYADVPFRSSPTPSANAIQTDCGARGSSNTSDTPAPNPSAFLRSLQTPQVERLEYSSIPTTDLEVGPVEWGRDITQEFHDLIATLPNHSGIETKSYTAVDHTREHHIRVRCEALDDAYVFLKRWREGPRAPQLDHVSVNYIVANAMRSQT